MHNETQLKYIYKATWPAGFSFNINSYRLPIHSFLLPSCQKYSRPYKAYIIAINLYMYYLYTSMHDLTQTIAAPIFSKFNL